MPRLPVESGCSARMARPAFVSSDGLATTRPPNDLDEAAAVRLLVVRDLHHPHVDLEPEDAACECKRRAPLAGAGLGRQARDAFLLVVVGLRDRGVRLVRARGRDAFVLVVDARRRLERLLETARAVERRRPPLPVDRSHLLGDRDESIGRDLLPDDRHREERREVVRADGLPGAGVEHGRRGCREIGRDVVPGLREPALVEDVLHLVGHLALLSLGGGARVCAGRPRRASG